MPCVPWPKDFPKVFATLPVRDLMRHPLFTAAKQAGDKQAAEIVVSRFDLRELKPWLAAYPRAIFVTASSQPDHNQLPSALVRFLATNLGKEADLDCRKVNGVKHTGKSSFFRMLQRPQFHGSVKAGRDYIIVDDTLTTGSTLAELFQYVQAGGGRVRGAATLAYTKAEVPHHAGDRCLAVPPIYMKALAERFGLAKVSDMLRTHGLYDGVVGALTESEAWLILNFRTLDEFENALHVEQLKNSPSRVISNPAPMVPALAQVVLSRPLADKVPALASGPVC